MHPNQNTQDELESRIAAAQAVSPATHGDRHVVISGARAEEPQDRSSQPSSLYKTAREASSSRRSSPARPRKASNSSQASHIEYGVETPVTIKTLASPVFPSVEHPELLQPSYMPLDGNGSSTEDDQVLENGDSENEDELEDGQIDEDDAQQQLLSASYMSSFLSDAASMFDPNAYLTSQEGVQRYREAAAAAAIAAQEAEAIEEAAPLARSYGSITFDLPQPSLAQRLAESAHSTQNVAIPVLPFRRRRSSAATHRTGGTRPAVVLDDDEEAGLLGGVSALDPAADKHSLFEEICDDARHWYGHLTGTEMYESGAGLMGANTGVTAAGRPTTPAAATVAPAPLPAVAEAEAKTGIQGAMKSFSSLPGSNLGLILIVLCQLCYSTMNLFVKLLGEAQPELGPLEIVGVECLVMWLGCVTVMKLAKTPHILLGPPGVRTLLFVRGLAGFSSTLALYLALQHLSLSDATTITFIGPLLIGALGACLLGEPFSSAQIISGIISLGGVVLIARPSFLFGEEGLGRSTPGDADTADSTAAQRIWGVGCALMSVLSTAVAWISLRTIGNRSSTYHSIAYFALCSWVASFVAIWLLSLGVFGSGMSSGEDGQETVPFIWPDSTQAWLLLLLVGVFSLLAQVLQTLGLQREAAGRAASATYAQIIFATMWQTSVLHVPLEMLSVVGSLLIVGCGLWVASMDGRRGVGGGGGH